MSCLVIGRNVEFAFFDRLIEWLGALGTAELRADYIATAKNGQAEQLFDACGMEALAVDTGHRSYGLRIADDKPHGIPYIRCSVIGDGV